MKRLFLLVVGIPMTLAIGIIGISLLFNGQDNPTSEKTVENKTKTPEQEYIPEVKNASQSKKEYTGYCAIYGKYKKRYAECTGDYNPEAKIKAEAKAKECNESAKAVHGCTDKYQ